MRAWGLLVPFLLTVALAGCAESGTAPTEDDELQDLGLEATDSTGVIRGVVVDPAIVPVPGATVTLKGLDQSVVTTDAGVFGFDGLEPGTYFLETSKVGFNGTQTSVAVVAGVEKPPVVKILLTPNPSAAPFVEDVFLRGYLTCGAAVFATSVGCTTFGPVADAIGDQSIFRQEFSKLPQWVQGELVWESTQPLAGAFIWEITPAGSNTHIGYRETTTSPALAYLNETVTRDEADTLLDTDINFRFFGGPHELCQGIYGFGCGVTLEQEVEIFNHYFYNFSPTEGWRFTADGSHPVPS